MVNVFLGGEKLENAQVQIGQQTVELLENEQEIEQLTRKNAELASKCEETKVVLSNLAQVNND